MNIVRKWCYVFLLIAGIIFFQQFPNWYAGKITPNGYVYSGQDSWFDPWDVNVYTSAILWGLHGHLLLHNYYTTQAYAERLLYPVYPAIGYIFRLVNPFILFHVWAGICTFFLTAMIFIFSWKILKSFPLAVLSLFLIAFGGGIGWLFSDINQSADVSITGFMFTSAFQRPHEAIGLIVYFGTFMAYYFSFLKSFKTNTVLVFVCLFLEIFIYPYYLANFGLIAVTYLWINRPLPHFRKRLITLLILIGICGIVAGWYYRYLSGSAFATVSNLDLTHPSILAVSFGYGILMALVIISLKWLKTLDPTRWYFLLWFGISFMLSFLPLGFTRFYLRGLFFPLVLYVLISLQQLKTNNRLLLRMIVILLCIFVPLSQVRIFIARLTDIENNWIYIPRDLYLVYSQIEKSPVDGVLAESGFSNQIPPLTGKNVYVGHMISTPNAQAKIDLATKFFSGKMSETEAQSFLKTNNIHLILYGPDELNTGITPYVFLTPLYKNGTVTLFTGNK
jgi:hypothetical protein